MSGDVLLEEFEVDTLQVLESIYPTEISKTSERDIQIDVEPDDVEEGAEPFQLKLSVHYPHGYPDELPELSLEPIQCDLEENERKDLLSEMQTIGQENLGMAMTFTLVSHLREQLSMLVRVRAENQANAKKEEERLALEEEEARTRGTPVTMESFTNWKRAFDKGIAEKRAREDDEKMKNMTPKEREEWKRAATRLTGRQLFERNRNLEDETLMEEGSTSVDISQYERTKAEEQEDEEDHVRFSDSD